LKVEKVQTFKMEIRFPIKEKKLPFNWFQITESTANWSQSCKQIIANVNLNI